MGQKIDNRSTDIAACGVDEALAAAAEMSISEPAVDKHPEKRMKAAFKVTRVIWSSRTARGRLTRKSKCPS